MNKDLFCFAYECSFALPLLGGGEDADRHTGTKPAAQALSDGSGPPSVSMETAPWAGPFRCHGSRKCRAALAPPKATRGRGCRPQKMADGGASPAQQEGEMSAAGPGLRRERQHRGSGRPPSARDLQVRGRGGASRSLSRAERSIA